MDGIDFPKETYDMLREIGAYQNAQQRLCQTLVAGFISTNEQDVSYMDSFMDTLFDFMDPESDTEELYRDYLAHIATFNPKEAKSRIEDLEEHLGYKAHIVYAAAYVAQELHFGQKDKGGKDYFQSHLLVVGKNGNNWKEQVVGLLHDAAEDTSNDIPTILHLVRNKIEVWISHPDDKSWIDKFEDEFPRYPAEQCHLPIAEEWNEIAEALRLLNHHTASTREQYIERIGANILALKVKLNDLRSNMDISRIPHPTENDHEKWNRYKQEYEQLMEKFEKIKLSE